MIVIVFRLAWFLAAAIGLGLGLVAFREARQERAAVQGSDLNGARHLIAKTHTRSEALRAAAQFSLMFAAMVALSHGSQPATGLAGHLARAAFVIAATVLATNSFLDRRARQELIDLLEEGGVGS